MRTRGSRDPAPYVRRGGQPSWSVATVATVVPPVAAVVPTVLTAVATTVNPVGDDNCSANGGGGPAPASCCEWHVSFLP